jgi:hypothetical protein
MQSSQKMEKNLDPNLSRRDIFEVLNDSTPDSW